MEKQGALEYVELSQITPCPYQTRYSYNRENMQQLIDSIKQNGILQPLTATKSEQGYQLISGHRRLFAATILKMETVPLIVLEKTNEDIAVLCAIENLHREDLNFFEQAEAIKLLIEQLGLTQQQVGERLALSQSAVANKLKLLKMDKKLVDKMIKANLTERHARAISRLNTEKQAAALDYIIKQGFNVAQTDKYVDKILKGNTQKKKPIIHIKDIRIFTNTINKAVSIMKTAGFAASVQQNIDENTAEYRIIIPLKPHTAKQQKAAKEKIKAANEI